MRRADAGKATVWSVSRRSFAVSAGCHAFAALLRHQRAPGMTRAAKAWHPMRKPLPHAIGVSRIANPVATASRIEIIRLTQPVAHLVVDVLGLRDADATREPIALGAAAGVEEPARRRFVLERETEVESFARGRLQLGDDVLAEDRHDRLARADLDVV